MSKRMSIILCAVCFLLLLLLFYFEIRYPEAASEFVAGLLGRGAQP